jgi:hypothetical protein
MAAKIGTVRGYGQPPWTVLATRIPKSLHRAVKLRCVERDMSAMTFIIEAVQEKLARAASRGRPRAQRRSST